MQFLLVPLTRLAFVSAVGCLDDVVPLSQRRDLTNAEGESYPLGMWESSWTSAKLTSKMVQILIEEVLGFHVRTEEGTGTAVQMWAITGCETPWNATNRGCVADGSMRTLFHVGIEGWTNNNPDEWALIQRDYPATAPVNLGNMGFHGFGGQYLSARIIERAYEAEGLSLEYHRSYNASWHNPGIYFDRFTSVNTSDLLPCSETVLHDAATMQQFVDFTADWDGVETVDGSLRGKCFSGYFWLARACRADTSRCILFLTSRGWESDIMMQRATVFNMPVITADVRDWDTYSLLPAKVDGFYYWWEPDTTFLGIAEMLPVQYPRYDRSSWDRGLQTSSNPIISLDNYVSRDLQDLAPTVHELVNAFYLSMDVLNQLLLAQKVGKTSAMQTACNWLKENREVWEKWLPDNTKCFPQFGMFNKATEVFQENREGDTSNLVCRVCDSGSFSEAIRDGKGLTYVCKPCSPGFAQASSASRECEPCKWGEFQEGFRASSCKRCLAGTYQDTTGQSQCKSCPAQHTTLARGSESKTECVCTAGLIETDDGQCVPCTRGLSCPVGSTVQGLLTATISLNNSSANSVLEQPFVKPGYNADPADPLTIYRCGSNCPGGRPGACSAGRIGITCARCPADTFAGRGRCMPCAGTWIWVIGGGILLFACIFPAYYFLTQRYTAKTRILAIIPCVLGLLLNLLQNLLVVSAVPTTWPALVTGLANSFNGVLLNLEGLGLACLGPSRVVPRYVSQVLLFPGVIGILLLIFAVSQLSTKVRACRSFMTGCHSRIAFGRALPEMFSWTWYGTACMIGKFCHSTFPTMANVSLWPMMCYAHPGGQQSLVKFSNTFCGTADHVTMLSAAGTLLAFTTLFLAICIWLSRRAPSLSVEGQTAAKFFFEDFRPDVAWFGLVTLFRGLFLSLPPVVAPNSPNLQMVLLHSVILLSVAFQGYCQPWKSPALNLIDLVSQSLFLTLLGVGLAGLQQNEDDVDVLESLGMWVCICLLVVFGVVIITFALAVVLEKVANYGTMARKVTTLGHAPEPEALVFLLLNVAGSIRRSASARQSLLKALDQLGTHDARMILFALTILEVEVGLVSTWGSRALTPEDAAVIAHLSTQQPYRVQSGESHSVLSQRHASRFVAAQLGSFRFSSDDLENGEDSANMPKDATDAEDGSEKDLTPSGLDSGDIASFLESRGFASPIDEKAESEEVPEAQGQLEALDEFPDEESLVSVYVS